MELTIEQVYLSSFLSGLKKHILIHILIIKESYGKPEVF